MYEAAYQLIMQIIKKIWEKQTTKRMNPNSRENRKDPIVYTYYVHTALN